MLDRPQQLPQVDFTSSKLRAQRLVLSAHGFKSDYAVADRLKSTCHEWQLRTRERFVHCVNTVTVHMPLGKISENRLAHDITFDCKVFLRHVQFDVFLHLTQAFSRTVEVTISYRPRQLPHVT